MPDENWDVKDRHADDDDAKTIRAGSAREAAQLYADEVSTRRSIVEPIEVEVREGTEWKPWDVIPVPVPVWEASRIKVPKVA